jgi:hypothetical protein
LSAQNGTNSCEKKINIQSNYYALRFCFLFTFTGFHHAFSEPDSFPDRGIFSSDIGFILDRLYCTIFTKENGEFLASYSWFHSNETQNSHVIATEIQ